MQATVQAASIDELIVRALFFDNALIQHHDAVNPLERGDPV